MKEKKDKIKEIVDNEIERNKKLYYDFRKPDESDRIIIRVINTDGPLFLEELRKIHDYDAIYDSINQLSSDDSPVIDIMFTREYPESMESHNKI